MKKMMSIAAVALFMTGMTVLACDTCGCSAKKVEKKTECTACSTDKKAETKCGADCKKACCTKAADTNKCTAAAADAK